MQTFDGALVCARYAFAPNLLHYCGPDTNGDFGEYLREEAADLRLLEHIGKFETLYPYLKAIAEANGIADPLDPRVVEAYWVGNSLLEKLTPQDTFVALSEKQHLPRRIPKNELRWLLPKIDKKARLHHSFHVFNVFTRTGHHTVVHTVETMDQCRISWGKVKKQEPSTKNQGRIILESQKLMFEEGKLQLVAAEREVLVPTDALGKRLRGGGR